MRILLVNKFLYPQGGAERHVFALQKLLTEQGHEVAVFAMDHPDNIPSPQAKYFVSRVDFHTVRGGWQGLRAAGRMLYSFEARRKLGRLLDEFRPDVVHLHNIYHQISPSILPLLKKRGIPVVQTLHDYSLISPNYNLFHDGQICEHGFQGKFYENIKHRCVKGSRLASTLAALEMTLHRWSNIYRRHVQTFISPSQFLIDTMRAWGFIGTTYRHLPNFIELDQVDPRPGDYFLFLGRLSPEKGVGVLLNAAAHTNFPIKIVGTGPEENKLKNIVLEKGLANVEFLGSRSGDALQRLVRDARALIVPSLWYENNPLVVLEAYAQGTPVVASDIGGLPEMVQAGRTGYLFSAGNAPELAGLLNKLADERDHALELGRQAQAFVQQFAPQPYYDQLMTIYHEAVALA